MTTVTAAMIKTSIKDGKNVRVDIFKYHRNLEFTVVIDDVDHDDLVTQTGKFKTFSSIDSLELYFVKLGVQVFNCDMDWRPEPSDTDFQQELTL